MAASWYAVLDKANHLGVPVIVAGDIFNTWDNPAELVNFAIDCFKAVHNKVYAIPGQHDLPNHNYEDAKKSSYFTLVKADAIVDMEPGFAYTYDVVSRADQAGCNVRLWPFPWGMNPEPPSDPDWREGADLHVAVVHRYIWYNEDTSYTGAPEDRHVHSYSLAPYDAAIFGDNHIGFHLQYRKNKEDHKQFGWMFNCGGFMRRNIDQKEYKIRYGEMRSSGSISPHFYRPAGADAWTEQSVLQSLKEIANATSPVARLEAVQQFIEEAGELLFDFRDVVAKYIQAGKLPDEVKKILEEVTGAKRPG